MTLTSEAESTRKFKVTADLTQATEEPLKFPLTIENLPSGLTALANTCVPLKLMGRKQHGIIVTQ